MLLIDTKYRTDKPEIMDDFAMQGDMLRDALDKIASINQILGGNSVTLCGISELLANVSKESPITIIDLGCGNGDMLRKIADSDKLQDYKFTLIGIDANNFTIAHAKNLSLHYPNVTFSNLDIFSDDFSNLKYDIALCTLTLHHFKDDEILNLTQQISQKARLGVIVNDLHRSAVAYRLFQIICAVFRLNKMSREDGLTSILRGFTKGELIAYSKKLGFKNYKIRWKWAFRYQWIILKR